MTTSAEHDRPAHSDPIALAIEALVYAPIGAAAFVREMGPDVIRTVVARGRAEVDVVHEMVTGRVKHAKGAGEVAIAFGLPVLRRKVEQRLATLRPSEPQPAPTPARVRRTPPASTPIVVSITAEETDPAAPNNARAGSNGHQAGATAPSEPAPTEPAPTEQLAIPGYDALSASQVVERLAGLSGDELAAVRHYETGHRRRRTILGKIEQLIA
jgi:hypothetical protein